MQYAADYAEEGRVSKRCILRSPSQTLETVISETLNGTYSVWIVEVSEANAEAINVNLLVHQLFAPLTDRERKINCGLTYIFEDTSDGVRNGFELLQLSLLAFNYPCIDRVHCR